LVRWVISHARGCSTSAYVARPLSSTRICSISEQTPCQPCRDQPVRRGERGLLADDLVEVDVEVPRDDADVDVEELAHPLADGEASDVEGVAAGDRYGCVIRAGLQHG
jgi:hypothetical protein